MPLLEHDGVFTMHVDQGWMATLAEDTYELLPPEGEGALHISVYERRTTEPLSEDEIRRCLGSFLENLDPDDDVDITVLAESAEQHRAVARCSSTDPATGTTFDWLVFVILWPGSLIIASATVPPGSGLLATAELMFAGIAPVPRRGRRFFRRK